MHPRVLLVLSSAASAWAAAILAPRATYYTPPYQCPSDLAISGYSYYPASPSDFNCYTDQASGYKVCTYDISTGAYTGPTTAEYSVCTAAGAAEPLSQCQARCPETAGGRALNAVTQNTLSNSLVCNYYAFVCYYHSNMDGALYYGTPGNQCEPQVSVSCDN